MEIGAPAVPTVVEVLRLVLEPALTLLQITVEMNVREKLMIHKLATRILVQVMHSFFFGNGRYTGFFNGQLYLHRSYMHKNWGTHACNIVCMLLQY